ncbi:MAG: polyphosphate kinase 1, partial [Candidatus Hydrogenedentota bacterium]
MGKTNLDDPTLFVNRELSWLEFNQRVLEQGRRSDVPPLERLKFLSIASRNLDEFFMIRVGGLKQQVAAGLSGRDITGLTPAEQLERISERAHLMVYDQSQAINETLDELNRQGIALIETKDITAKQKDFIFTQFLADILPALTPLAVQEMTPPPLLPGLQLNLAAVLSPASEQGDDIENHEPDYKIAVAPIPGNLARFIRLPSDGAMQLARLEQVIALHCGHLFPQHRILAISFFRITRDADVSIADDDAADLLNEVEDAVRSRRRSAVVRLEISAGADPRIQKWLKEYCDIDDPDIYEVEGIINPGDLMEAGNLPGFEKMRYSDWPPQRPRDLVGYEDLWQAIQERDILLIHPYESFEPVVEMVNLAADDPNVLAIKQTLYRTSGDSPIVRGLARAAENGKQVTVLVELKARFDEAANVNWARRLEDAGCHVIYGIVGLKTHAKALLIVRREPHGIRRYVHVSTGNYNDRTARIYSDFGLLTCEKGFTADAAAFFNMLTGYSQEVGWSRFAIAPTGLRNRIYDLIEREINASTSDRPGLIMAKLNSLQDGGICKALYRASQAGVKVMLNIRGI